jgi:hypothetical protein
MGCRYLSQVTRIRRRHSFDRMRWRGELTTHAGISGWARIMSTGNRHSKGTVHTFTATTLLVHLRMLAGVCVDGIFLLANVHDASKMSRPAIRASVVPQAGATTKPHTCNY